MKALALAAALSALLPPGCAAAAPAPAPSIPAAAVYTGCTPPPRTFDHVFYVSPTGGRGDGSAAAPFSRVEQALAAAKAGDLVLLGTGAYGVLNLAAKNARFVTVAAAPGQRPVVAGLQISQAASHWRISGLKIIAAPPPDLDAEGWPIHPLLVRFYGGDNIVFDNNTVATSAGDFAWESWQPGRRPAHPLSSGISADNGSCTSLVRNNFHNLFNAVSAGGDQRMGLGEKILIQDNQIDGFAGDGIDFYGSHMLLWRNRIVDGHEICRHECIHTDAIQGWNYENLPGQIVVDVTVDSNFIVQQTRPDMVLPADDLHGIAIFNGNWDRMRVVNNVVVSPTWHGLSLYGVRNAVVANNTVLSPTRERAAWIMITAADGSAPQNVVVRNNITSSLRIGENGRPVAGVTQDHNLIMDDPRPLFVAFDPVHARYDLHLAKQSAARHRGSAEAAPSSDIEGRIRNGDIAAGAYASDANAKGPPAPGE